MSQEGTARPGMQHSAWWNRFVAIVLFENSDIVICKGIPTLAGRLLKKKQLWMIHHFVVCFFFLS